MTTPAEVSKLPDIFYFQGQVFEFLNFLCLNFGNVMGYYRVFNLKVDRQLSREYFTSDAIYNGPAGMTLCYYMYRSWQDCCRGGENRSWPSVSVESVDSECWCLKNAIFDAFIMRLTVEKRVFILESNLKTMSYAHCRQSFFEKFRKQAPVKSAIAKMMKKFLETGSLLGKNRNRQKSVLTPGILQDIQTAVTRSLHKFLRKLSAQTGISLVHKLLIKLRSTFKLNTLYYYYCY